VQKKYRANRKYLIHTRIIEKSLNLNQAEDYQIVIDAADEGMYQSK